MHYDIYTHEVAHGISGDVLYYMEFKRVLAHASCVLDEIGKDGHENTDLVV